MTEHHWPAQRLCGLDQSNASIFRAAHRTAWIQFNYNCIWARQSFPSSPSTSHL